LASYDNSNTVTSDSAQVAARLSPMFSESNLLYLNQSISAQVTAGPHRPWYNTWCNTSWQMCHTALFYEKTIYLTAKHQKHQPFSDVTSQHPLLR